MRLLLDTHILIWAMSTPDRLSPAVREALTAPGNDVLVSAASAWELSIKHALGRIVFPLAELAELLDRMGLEALPISVAHAVAAGALPRHHNDPFDRMLVAQARLNDLLLVTEDAMIRRYDAPIFGQPGP
ncbi:MAG: type II toxin-antitoxin system VapC family toxin [Thalassobaculum sp.]|uniref:type II toxin-antitoxin system VapC family toxin n=1 Tax=Thalassobaculum sp. TaxID=2022740 RepID=UPI0032ECE036